MPHLHQHRILSFISLSLILAGLASALLIGFPQSHAKSVSVSNSRDEGIRQRNQEQANEEYGKLPLSFVARNGREDSRVKFISRGAGYSLFLTSTEAVFVLTKQREDKGGASEQQPGESLPSTPEALPAQSHSFSMKLMSANPNPLIAALDELPGKVNYLIGNEAGKWQTNVATYSKVKYHGVYPGVDLVYYGNQQKLEYDFIVAPGANAGRIEIAFKGIEKLALDEQGNLLLETGGGHVTLNKPVAYQEVNGQRIGIASRYALKSRGRVGFKLGRYNKRLPLIIDPVLAYSTYLGGSASDRGLSIAVDSSGSAFVTGQTYSVNFPVIGSQQPALAVAPDVFVTKLNPAGTTIIYSTFLGGNGTETGYDIAIDAAGSAYITGNTNSTNFPTVNALHPSLTGSYDAFVTELNAAGNALIYSTYLGGSGFDSGNSIALDSAGNTYVAGEVNSKDFPVSNAIQTKKSGSAVFKSADGAVSWNPSDAGLTAANVNNLVFNPQNTAIIYAATDTGIYKTIDGGNNWSNVGAGQTPTPVNRLAVNPVNTSIIYATTAQGIYKSTDGGSTWHTSSNGLTVNYIQSIVIDPTTPETLYAAGPFSNFVHKSTDGGASWSNNFITNVNIVNSLAIDPTTPSTIYAGTNRGVYKSINGGTTWSAINTGLPFQPSVNSLVIDKTNPSIIFIATGAGVFKSTNGGSNWAAIPNLPFISSLVFDPTNSSIIYAVTSGGSIFRSTDGGNNWSAFNTGSSFALITVLLIDPTNPSIIYYGTFGEADAFITKLTAGGASQTYSTYLGGVRSDISYGVAADTNGNAFVVGSTNSANFPVANALQPNKAEAFTNDVFITKINPAGSALVYSTYLGGDGSDIGRDIALDSSGNVYVTGSTASFNFPVVGAAQSTHGGSFGNDAFVTKVNAAGSALVYSTYLGGDDDDQGYAIAVAPSGSCYLTGLTRSFDFPVASAVQATKNNSSDAFVTKVSPSGSALVYSTFIGGNGSDEAHGIALDAQDNPYVAGTTTATDFPRANPLQTAAGGGGDAFVLKLLPAVDLSVTMTDSPDPVVLGSNLTYTIVVKNDGDLAATGVTINDTIPAGAVFVSASSTQGACSGTGLVSCNLGNLNAGNSATVTLVVKPPAVKTITNTASATSNESDGNATNNTATATTQVTFVDLSVQSATAYNKVAQGSRINYLFTVKNNSGSTADSVTLTDNLPSGTTFVSCSAQGGVCNGSGNNRTATFSSLAVGQSAIVVIIATVDNSVPEGTTISNTATVASAIVDADSSNNSTTTTITVTATPLRRKTNGKIAFSTGIIFTVKADGSEAATQFPGIPNAIFPTWSPDGTKLAFTVSKYRPVYPNDSYTEIDVVNADGTGLIAIADNSTDTSFNWRSRCDWSPDGTRIAYVSKDRTIYIANADGTGFAKLPNSPSEVKDLDWSPDGSKFLFSQLGDIYVMNIDGSGLTKLIGPSTGADGPISNIEPSWSPDMSRILFTQKSNNYSDVFIMNADGTGAQRFLNTRYTNAPAWSPDGTQVAFYQQTEVHVANLDATGDIKLASNEGCCGFGAISWQPIPTNDPLPPPPPVSQTYSIAGRVTNSNGAGFISYTTVILSGTRNVTITPDFDGNYLFVNLPSGGNYTVTPTSVAFNFSPASRTINNLNANQTGIDFVGTYIPANISGHVKDTDGNPLANVQVETRNGYPEGSTYTDVNGYYVFPNVQRGRTYYVYVRQGAGAYTFTPDSVIIPNLNSDQTADFVGTRHTSNKISGRVTSNDAPGVGLGGVQVVLAREINQAAIVYTDSNGFFSFGDQQSGYNYSVYIFDQSGYVYTPRTINIPALSSDQLQVNFVRYPFSSYAIISGKVADANGNPVSGVTLTLSGAANSTTSSGNNGTYSFLNIPAGLNYTMTPSKSGYTFSPTQQALNNLSTNPPQVNFTALIVQGIQLSQASYTVGEAGGSAQLVVNRTDTTTAATVNYATSDTSGLNPCNSVTGQASSRCDYATSIGTLRFAAGESAKTIYIPIIDDNIADGNETFSLSLSNPTGASFGAISTATITITDNANTAGNPIDGANFFIREHYIDFLGREPEPAGLAGWLNVYNNCGTTVAQPCDRIEISSAFFRSPEFQDRAYFIYRFYSAVGKIPLYEGFMPDFAKVSGFLSAQELEANKVAFVNEFMARPDYQNKYGSISGNDAYVTALLNTLGLPGHSRKTEWVNALNGGATRATVLRSVTEDSQVYQKYYNEAFVIMQYFGYLRRSADISYLNWIQTMNTNGGDYRQMINGFLNSAEYRQRFGQ